MVVVVVEVVVTVLLVEGRCVHGAPGVSVLWWRADRGSRCPGGVLTPAGLP
jgi:hypothetical protein